jgi:hypothetical protein
VAHEALLITEPKIVSGAELGGLLRQPAGLQAAKHGSRKRPQSTLPHHCMGGESEAGEVGDYAKSTPPISLP